jgi:sugar phosphate permease
MSIRAEAKVPYIWFFSNIRSFFGLLTCTYVCLIFSFHGSFFTLALTRGKGIDEYYHGFIIMIQPCFFVICTFLVGYVIDKLPKRVFIAISFAACGVAIAVMGPSHILGLPNYLWILCIG